VQTILITGTSTGLGAHTAVHLARRGYRVFASMRDPRSGMRVRRAIEQGSLACEIVQLDVHKERSVRAAVKQVLSSAGRLDVVVNNAGVSCTGALEELDVEQARGVFETNYFGAMRVTRAVLPHFRMQGHGTIINISSVAGRVAMAGAGHYTASKFALEGASEALALEVRPFNIRVALIEPGLVLTPILTKAPFPDVDSSPYSDHMRRAMALVRTRMAKRTPARAVAEAVERAIVERGRRFRYPVGEDAEHLCDMRARLSDEHFIETTRPMTDDEYFDQMTALAGVDLWR